MEQTTYTLAERENIYRKFNNLRGALKGAAIGGLAAIVGGEILDSDTLQIIGGGGLIIANLFGYFKIYKPIKKKLEETAKDNRLQEETRKEMLKHRCMGKADYQLPNKMWTDRYETVALFKKKHCYF
jgi:hypothetical protein